MDNSLYAYEPITARPELRWPEGKRVAFYIGLNLEHFHVDGPSTTLAAQTVGLVPDPLNYGWRDYGLRVGIWRLIETLDRLGLTVSACINSELTSRYPQVIEAGLERGWAWVAHGVTNSRFHAGFADIADERGVLSEMVDVFAHATGQRPKGWLGPALSETFDTCGLLADLGFEYVLDWACDDQPFRLNTGSGNTLISVPYSVELNDMTIFANRSFTGPEFVQMVMDEYAQLSRDSASGGRVMALGLHPFVSSRPARHRYLEEALEFIGGRDDVWLTTSDEIARWFRSEYLGVG